MKKMFFMAIVMFVFCLTINLRSNTSSIKNNALADGTCCLENGALCEMNQEIFWGYYYKTSGSCKKDENEELQQVF